MDTKSLKAQQRKVLGRKVKHLRGSGILPANIYGKKIKSQAIEVDLKEFQKIYNDVGETGLVELQLSKDKKPVLIHHVQNDPVTDVPIHADFLQVDLKQKVTTSVPIEVSGESPAEKLSVGTAVQYLDEVEVEALPTDLPEKFVVDISGLSEVDQAIYLKDLSYDKAKVELKADAQAIVVKVEPPQKEEVALPPAEAEVTGEGEVAGDKVPQGEEGSQETQETKPEEAKPKE